MLAHEAMDEGVPSQEVIKERLESLFDMVTDEDHRLEKKQLFTQMVSTYRTMCTDEFGKNLFDTLHTNLKTNNHDSDPGDDSVEHWHIPLPGDEGEVRFDPMPSKVEGRGTEDEKPPLDPDDRSTGDLVTHEDEYRWWVTKRSHQRYTYAVVRIGNSESGTYSYTIWATRFKFTIFNSVN